MRAICRQGQEDIEKLSQETFVFFNRAYAPHYYNSLLEICAWYGFSPNVVHESNNIGSIIQLVRNGLGVSIVPASIANIHSYPEIAFCAWLLIQDLSAHRPSQRANVEMTNWGIFVIKN